MCLRLVTMDFNKVKVPSKCPNQVQRVVEHDELKMFWKCLTCQPKNKEKKRQFNESVHYRSEHVQLSAQLCIQGTIKEGMKIYL